jgi:WD40 repeat protein
VFLGTDKTVRIWHNIRHIEVAQLEHRGPIMSIAWPDHDHINSVILLCDDGTVGQWSEKVSYNSLAYLA